MSRTYSNTSKATHEKTTNFFDFVDFFLLLKDSINNALTNEALYSDLTYVLHEDANWEINNIKDAISKILRKKIGFKNLLESATPMLIEPLADYYEKSSFIINYITQPQTFTEKVLYRVKQDATDNELFNGEDVAVLESNRDNLPYILAFVLIRTIENQLNISFFVIRQITILLLTIDSLNLQLKQTAVVRIQKTFWREPAATCTMK